MHSIISYFRKIATSNDIDLNEFLHLLCHASRLSLTNIYNANLTDLEDIIDKVVYCMKNEIPITRLTKYRYFYDDWFYISPFTLDPRPETEELVHKAISLNVSSILDIGTGSGCILISILKNLKKAHGVGLDISQYTLENAKYNSLSILNSHRCSFIYSTDELKESFDLIVSNPPYVCPLVSEVSSEVFFDPPLSIYYKECVYEELFQIAKKTLSKNGYLLIELPSYSYERVSCLAQNYKFNMKNFLSKNGIIYVCLKRH